MSDPISYMPWMVKKDLILVWSDSTITFNCEMCNKIMTQEAHDFCDLCDDCRPEEF